jgi:MFS family permease
MQFPDGRSRIPLRMIVLLALAHSAFAGGRLALTLLAVHLHASPLAIGVLMSLLMVVPMFIAVPVGRWADRVGFHLPTWLGLAMQVTASVLVAVWPMLPVMAVASVLVGSGYMLAHVAVNNAIGQASGLAGRAQAFGAMALGFSISGLAGPMVTGIAIDHLGDRLAVALLVLPVLASAALMLWPQRMPTYAAEAPQRAASSGVRDLLRDEPLRMSLIVGAAISVGFDLFTFLMPLHGARNGFSASAIGFVVGAFGAGSFAVRLAIPWLVRTLDEWRLLGIALALTAGCYLLFPFTHSLWTMLPLAFALGVVLGCGQPLGMSLVHRNAPAARTGEAVGLRSTIGRMSQTLMPLLSGAVGAAAGLVPVFWATALLLAGGSWYARKARLLLVRRC